MCPSSSCARSWLLARIVALAVVSSVTCVAVDAQATDGVRDVDRARAAYDRGVRANGAKDYGAAAKAFAEADALAPAPASLEAAIEAAMKADDAVLGADLVERADGRPPPDAGLRASIEAARKRFAGRTGKIRVECTNGVKCLASVDGAAADAQRLIFVAVGPHAVVVQRGEERIDKIVEVRAGEVLVVGAGASAGANGDADAQARADARARADAEARAHANANANANEKGISSSWVWVGVGMTGVAGALTLISALDAKGLHDRFDSSGCGAGGTGKLPADCDDKSRDGKGAQLRTNVLLGATAAIAVGTAALGLFVVRWNDGAARVTIGAGRGTAMAGLEIVTP